MNLIQDLKTGADHECQNNQNPNDQEHQRLGLHFYIQVPQKIVYQAGISFRLEDWNEESFQREAAKKTHQKFVWTKLKVQKINEWKLFLSKSEHLTIVFPVCKKVLLKLG